jgi:hypothetical protein
MDADGDDELEEDFPLGDGTVESSATVYCPYCAEPVEITLDPGSGAEQEYVEDCEVCCRPWHVTVSYDAAGTAHVTASPADE